jgi:hypothetical protein
VGVVVVRAAALLLALLATACARGAESPRQVVDAYFTALGHDPLRSLALVTREFHGRHALHAVTTSEARRVLRGHEPAAIDAEALAMDRLELGWLMVQARPAFVKTAGDNTRSIVAEETTGDTARVTTRIAPREGSVFEQEFSLVRGADGTWRIDAIEQRGVDATNGVAAFVAHPTDAARRALEASLRKRGR